MQRCVVSSTRRHVVGSMHRQVDTSTCWHFRRWFVRLGPWLSRMEYTCYPLDPGILDDFTAPIDVDEFADDFERPERLPLTKREVSQWLFFLSIWNFNSNSKAPWGLAGWIAFICIVSASFWIHFHLVFDRFRFVFILCWFSLLFRMIPTMSSGVIGRQRHPCHSASPKK